MPIVFNEAKVGHVYYVLQSRIENWSRRRKSRHMINRACDWQIRINDCHRDLSCTLDCNNEKRQYISRANHNLFMVLRHIHGSFLITCTWERMPIELFSSGDYIKPQVKDCRLKLNPKLMSTNITNPSQTKTVRLEVRFEAPF